MVDPIPTSYTTLNGDGFKYVEAVYGGANDASGDLRMPVDFFDVLLTLVHKQKLRGYVFEFLALGSQDLFCAGFVLVLFDREVPDRHLLVGAGCDDHRVFCGVPFDGGYGPGVPF